MLRVDCISGNPLGLRDWRLLGDQLDAGSGVQLDVEFASSFGC